MGPKGQLTLYKVVLLVVCAVVLSVAFYFKSTGLSEYVLTGPTMGVSYTVRYVSHDGQEHPTLAEDIDQRLKQINQQMSTWQDDSDISAFNRSLSKGWQTIPHSLLKVVQTSQMISRKTDGRFDITIGPLVSLWGFHNNQDHLATPNPADIERTRQRVGWEKLQLQQSPPAIKKMRSDLQIDVSATAKGYGVDALAQLLELRQITDYMVEIGGEIRVNGSNSDGQNWRLAIEAPKIGARTVFRQLEVSQGSVATSGDYRNYYEVDNVRYSHLIDPIIASPIRHKTTSVTIVADTAMLADGWATAMMILGAEKGLRLAEQEGLAALFIVRDPEEKSGYRQVVSHKMGQYLKSQD